MPQNPHNLLSRTRIQVKKLRDRVNKLKRDQKRRRQEATQIIEHPQKDIPKQKEHLVIEFSMGSVAKATLVVIGLIILAVLLFKVKQILILIFVSLFLASVLESNVDKMETKKISRVVSIL